MPSCPICGLPYEETPDGEIIAPTKSASPASDTTTQTVAQELRRITDNYMSLQDEEHYKEILRDCTAAAHQGKSELCVEGVLLSSCIYARLKKDGFRVITDLRRTRNTITW